MSEHDPHAGASLRSTLAHTLALLLLTAGCSSDKTEAAPEAAPEDDSPCEGSTWYQDQDGDGYGVPDVTTEGCDPGEGWADNAVDCDDTDASRIPDGVWEGDFPLTWEDPVDWGELCAACINEVDGNLWIAVGGDAVGALAGAETAATFACVEHVRGSVSITTSESDVDGLERMRSIDGNLTLTGADLAQVDALSGLSAVGSLYLDLPSASPDLTGLSGLVASGTFLSDIHMTLGGGSLDFLAELQTMEGSLVLSGSPDDLSGLAALSTVDGTLSLRDLDVPSLDGLGGLRRVGSDLNISGTSITDLAGLGEIQVDGGVTIDNNGSLTTLMGVETITGQWSLTVASNPALRELAPLVAVNVGEYLSLVDNAALENLDGLGGLTALPLTNLQIASNRSLEDLDGLAGLTAVLSLWLDDNDALVSLDGLSALQTVERELVITEHDALANIDGLGALTNAGSRLTVWGNDALSDVDGLAGLTELDELYILENDSLTHVDGLSGLGTVGTVNIEDNPSLANLDGLANLETADTLRISQNYSLADISGIDGVVFTSLELLSLTDVTTLPSFSSPDLSGASIHIEGVYVLATIDSFNGMTSAGSIYFGNIDTPVTIGGFTQLTRIDRNLNIQESFGLLDVSGFSALESVGGSIYIGTNEGGFRDISGLGALTEVSERITISDNLSLTDISGLGSLEAVGIQLDIANNPNLCASIAEGIAAGVSVGGDVNTDGNDDGC